MYSRLTTSSAGKAQPRSFAYSLIKATVFRRAAGATIAIILAATISNAQSADTNRPRVRLKGISLERIDLDKGTAETTISIQVDNRGPALDLRDVSYRLKLNDKPAAEGKLDRKITLPARANTNVQLPCTIDLSALPGAAWNFIVGGFDLRYELETEFNVPILPGLSPRLKTSTGGDLSLVRTVSGWTARLKEHLSSKQ